MKALLKKINQKILWILPKTLAHKIMYYKAMRKKLDLKNPKDLNQKIIYSIIYKYGEKEAMLSDKYAVKKYIENLQIPDLYFAKIYKTYNSVDDINLSELPDKFVLKTNHGCKDFQICSNKDVFDMVPVKKKLDYSLKRNMAKEICEYFSVNIPPILFAEEYLETSCNAPFDFNFYCIHGVVEVAMIINYKKKNITINTFDRNLNALDIVSDGFFTDDCVIIPDNCQKMIEVAELLAKPFPFVRVDLYNVDGKIYFGEFTFTPTAGCVRCIKSEEMIRLGNLLNI
jgi:hypothetical protein